MPYQLSVFAENKPGKIEKVTKILEEHNINIRAITISDAGDYGIIKLLVNKPQEAAEALKENNLAATLKEIIAIRMEDKPGALGKIASLFSKNGINVQDAYGFIVENSRTAVFIFQIDHPAKIEAFLKENNICTLTESELYLV